MIAPKQKAKYFDSPHFEEEASAGMRAREGGGIKGFGEAWNLTESNSNYAKQLIIGNLARICLLGYEHDTQAASPLLLLLK